MSLKFSMFRTPKHQQYEYKPRYWDPEKEEKEKRRQHLERLRNKTVEGSKTRISSGFRRGYVSDQSIRRRQVMRSNLILLGIVVMLVLGSLLFLGEVLPQIESFLGGGGQRLR